MAFNRDKNPKLPVVQLREVVDELVLRILQMEGLLQNGLNADESKENLQTLMDYALNNGVLEEEDLVPF